MKEFSKEHWSIGPRAAKPFAFSADMAVRAIELKAMLPNLGKLGIQGLSPHHVRQMMDFAEAVRAERAGATAGMDAALQPLLTTTNIATPIQFLQTWLPGFVGIITAARKIDEILGMSTVGDWENEQIIQGYMEPTGTAVLYGDYTNVPYSSWNVNWDERTIVRFEEGMRAGILEEARASKVQINSAETKRAAATEALEINRNTVGWSGFNNGNGKTYGFLNDPNLPAATQFPATGTGSSPLWANKNFAQIQADLRLAISTLRINSQATIDPKKVKLTIVLATSVVDYLSVTTDQGVSVQAWLDDAYPGIRIIDAPQMENAISGDNAFYLFAESVSDDVSTDDKRTWLQMVPAKFRLLGVSQQTKGYEEDYSNATAGVMLKRPYAVVRFYNN